MKWDITPTVVIIILIAIIPQLSEAMYTPALPDVAKYLMISDTSAEYTLTVYLLGFAVGSLIFGKASDIYGRKPCLLLGIGLYILGCLFCFLSTNIQMLLASRFLQAFGCSVGSVLGQSICRDIFSGRARSKLFATLSMAIYIVLAVAPALGGVTVQYLGWQSVFLLLIIASCIIWAIVYFKLPETHLKHNRTRNSMFSLTLKMLKDIKVMAYGFLVAGGNGLTFSYFAEGSFYMIELLDITPFYYGLSFLILASAGLFGSVTARKLHDTMLSFDILRIGILSMILGSSIFSAVTIILMYASAASWIHIILTLLSMAITTFGIGIVLPSSLSEALQNYQSCIGTASALFGFIYYIGISLITFGMGLLHNGSLITMPLYFLSLSLCMMMVFNKIIVK